MANSIYQCLRPECRFRFPAGAEEQAAGGRCPKCGGPLRQAVSPYEGLKVETSPSGPGKSRLEALLDNLRSAFNVGSIFRSADGAGIRPLYLCGTTPAPGSPKVAKTALGSEFHVPWQQSWDGVETAAGLRARGRRLWALEGGPRAGSIFDALPDLDGPPVVLVVGSEVAGVDPAILAECERTVYLPMEGQKDSFNVAVAFGIAAYLLRHASRITEKTAANLQ